MEFSLLIALALIAGQLWIIADKLNKIMSTQKEAAAQLTAINDELVKVGAETQTLLDNVAALTAAAANSDNVSPELQAAIDTVAAQAKKVDDLVPDATAPTA